MILADLKTTIRSIARKRVNSLISILGLGIGLGCNILLLALILHETSFNKYIPGYQNLFRIVLGNSGFTHYPLAEEMKREFPEVKDFFRFYQTDFIQLRNSRDEIVKDGNFSFSDPAIFRILGIKMISGTPASTSSEVAVSEKTAMKYFGDLSPLGEVLQVKLSDTFIDLIVTGVYSDFPASSTMYPDFIADIDLSEKLFSRFQKSLGEYGNENLTRRGWEYNDFITFVVLDKNTNRVALAGRMKKYNEFITNENLKDMDFSFQPVTDIYLRSGEIGPAPFLRAGNPGELKYYEAISLVILLISVINYIFLTRAATSDRLRELGTKKAFGASRVSLRNQIILESNIIALLSLIPATFVIDFGITFINNVLNKSLSTTIFQNPLMWIITGCVILFTGSISGLLIGFNYARIPAIILLSGKSDNHSRNLKLSNSFLVFHFSIYIILVAGVTTISKQIRYSMSGYVGINPRNVIVSNLNSNELKNSFTAICDEIEKVPGVIRTAGGSFIPPFGNLLPINLASPDGEKVRFDGLIMGEGMTELLGIEIKEGESFGEYSPAAGVLINECSAQKYNLHAGDNYLNFKIRGIVKDFHAHSLHTQIQPLVILQQNPTRMGIIAIKTDGTNDEAVIKRLRELFNQFAPDEIFEVEYLTDQVSSFYGRERNHAKIMGAFSILATVLSMMGLFGIALISITKRTKEIGIRKVNGASVAGILYLLNKDFMRWILISIAVSVPASIYLMSEWLGRFAYKTRLSWWIFGAAALSALAIAMITVSWQSWRAATKNPVEALRYE